MRTTLLILALGGALAIAAPRVSSSYSIPAEVTDAGGRRSTSASYEAYGSFHDATGIGTAGAPGNYTALHGFLSATTGGGLPSAFIAWQIANFGSTALPTAAPGADPDKDGLDNVTEFAFGMDPNLTSTAPLSGPATRGLPIMQFTSGNLPHVEIDYIRRTDNSVEYLVESSTDLLSWNPTVSGEGSTFVPFGTGYQLVTFIQFNAPPRPDRIYHRMRVTLVAP
jgi:hypothetical protein